MNKKVLLGIVLIFALTLRIYKLGHLELFGDELDVGYHAYSLWKTGRDYTGQKLPTYIHSFSEWRAPLLMYATAPFVGLFGLSAWSVRIPVVLFGLINIYLVYLLVRCFTNNPKWALFSAFILTITPWHIHYSRTAFEVTLLLSLILGGTILFIKDKYLFSAVCFGLSLYAYNTANVFVLLFGLVLIYLKKKELFQKPKQLMLPAAAIFLISLPLLVRVISGQASERFNLISIFNDQKTIEKVIHFRTTGLGPSFERVFHNKLTAWGSVFVNSYLTAFSPQFLFLSGDPNPRHSMPDWGQFYWILFPFLIYGILKLRKVPDSRFKILVISWLLISPIPAALTVGGGSQATRLFLMLPPLIILIALGVSKIKNNLLLLAFGLGLLAFSLFYLHNYFVHYQKETYQHWHYGYQKAMTWLKENRNDQRVIINNSNEPALIRYLFWSEIDPNWFHQKFSGDQIEKNILTGFDGFKLENTYFGHISEENKVNWLKANLKPDDLYLAFQEHEAPGDWNWNLEPPEGLEVLKTIYDPWGKPMIYWVTISD